MQESSLAHTKRDCVHHIVWIPKYRRKVLHNECRKEVVEIIRELVGKKRGCETVGGRLLRPRSYLPPGAAEVLGLGDHGMHQREERTHHQ